MCDERQVNEAKCDNIQKKKRTSTPGGLLYRGEHKLEKVSHGMAQTNSASCELHLGSRSTWRGQKGLGPNSSRPGPEVVTDALK